MKFSIKSIAMISWIIISIGLCFAVKSVLAGSFSDAFGVLIGVLIVAIFSYFLIVYWKKVEEIRRLFLRRYSARQSPPYVY